MKLDDIYQFFQNPLPTYLSSEQAVCYILSVLLQGESYGSELIQRLESEYPRYRLSDTVLYDLFEFKIQNLKFKNVEKINFEFPSPVQAPDFRHRIFILNFELIILNSERSDVARSNFWNRKRLSSVTGRKS